MDFLYYLFNLILQFIILFLVKIKKYHYYNLLIWTTVSIIFLNSNI